MITRLIPTTDTAAVKLGMLTPSSNTVLEPVCAAMLAGSPHVSVHFARVRVTQITLDEAGLRQFADTPMLDAAGLLADARVDSLCWNGTSGGWLGVARDRALCAEMTRRTGIPATTSVLAMCDALHQAGMTRIGLVTPYQDDVQARIVTSLAADGVTVVAERHLRISDNIAMGNVETAVIADMINEVAPAAPDAVVVLCTNLRGAPIVAELERTLGIPILDSVALAVWGALRAAKVSPDILSGWGRLFEGWPGS
jgi:maleate isomerase